MRWRRRGVDLLDTPAQAQAVVLAHAVEHDERIWSRSRSTPTVTAAGCAPTTRCCSRSPGRWPTGAAQVRGVMTHAGESYGAIGRAAQARAAEEERRASVEAAQRLRADGHAAPVVSIGSTPTAHAAQDLSGVTEVWGRVFVFFDLVMAGNGACEIDDIALLVVATVIGRGPDDASLLTTDLVLGQARTDPRDLDEATYREWSRLHPSTHATRHVHGANLGVRWSAFEAAGGFPPVPEHEDVLLVEAVVAAGANVAAGPTILTSGRLRGRVDGGFSGYLRLLAPGSPDHASPRCPADGRGSEGVGGAPPPTTSPSRVVPPGPELSSARCSASPIGT